MNEPQEKLKTKDIKPRKGEMIKPYEIIGMAGMEGWTLLDRRTWDILLTNAWGEKLENPNADFTISLRELRGVHDSNDRVKTSLEKMQRTLVRARLPDGSTRTVQMLGSTDIWDDDRNEGILKYDFHRKLVPLLRDSEIYARLDIKILTAFTSKYALALYEIIAARINLHRTSEEIDIDTLREWLGVGYDKLTDWKNLSARALKPAVEEVNGLSPFEVEIMPVKHGRTVVRVLVSWVKKAPFSPAEQSAVREVNRHKAGRSARISGTAENVVGIDKLYLAPKAKEAVKDATRRAGCALDMDNMEKQWRGWLMSSGFVPDNPIGSFQTFCVNEAKRQANG